MSRTGRTSTSEPGRNARTSLISTVKPPLTLPVMMPVTISAFSNAFSSRVHGASALGLLARQARLAEAVFDGVERDLDVVAGLDFELARVVLELLERDDGFGLQAGVDDDDVVGDVDDEPGEDHPRADALVSETLLEELRRNFLSYLHFARYWPCLYWTLILEAQAEM